MKKNHFFLLFVAFTFQFACAHQRTSTAQLPAPKPETKQSVAVNHQKAWVDKTYNSLTLDEKIGQLFVVAAYSNKDAAHENKIRSLVKNENIGGLIFMQDNALKQVKLTNEYQSLSKVPLLIAMDAEWGLNMRLKNTYKFPWAMTIGANADEKNAYKVGKKIAEHCKRMGVHMNYAPVVDVNTNPNNPIIGNRSFGSNKYNVSKKAIAYMNGMKSENVLGSAKHFPGHGDTDSDSHKTLPSVSHSLSRLENIELYPFKELIKNDVGGIMVAHLNVPALESDSRYPSSISTKIVTGHLKNKLGYKGLIITDALNMAGVANQFPAGIVDLKAFEAGNDVLLFSQAVATGKRKIKEAIQSGKIPMSRVEESVKKILEAKYFAGLHEYKPVSAYNLMQDLNDMESKSISQSVFDKALTKVKGSSKLSVSNQRIAFVPFGGYSYDGFVKELNALGKVETVLVNSTADISKLSAYDAVIVGVHKSSSSPYKSYKISSSHNLLIQKITQKKPTLVSLFTSPYGLKTLSNNNAHTILVAYQNTKEAYKSVAKYVFGKMEAKGVLPVDVDYRYKAGGKL